jgi:hypothetical protein
MTRLTYLFTAALALIAGARTGWLMAPITPVWFAWGLVGMAAGSALTLLVIWGNRDA